MTLTVIRTAIPIPYEKIAAFCERHHIARMWLFGSVLRDDFDAESDVDVLIQFEPTFIPTLLDLAAAQRRLTDLLGRQVDLITSDGLSPYVRDRVMDSMRVIYERS